MLYLIGLGLGDPKDITVKGLEIVRQCHRVYLEIYTSILGCHKEDLESFYGRQVLLANRELLEEKADDILSDSVEMDVGILIVGDPLAATQHTDFVLKAKEKKIPYKVVHNASIVSAISCCGLELHKFGETVFIPFWDETWKPDSFYDKIRLNRLNNMHTLCLLEIKQPTLGYRFLRFMTVSEAALQLLTIVKRKDKLERNTILDEQSLCIGVARIGQDSQNIVVNTLINMASKDMGAPLHSLVIPAREMTPHETEFLQEYAAFNLDNYHY